SQEQALRDAQRAVAQAEAQVALAAQAQQQAEDEMAALRRAAQAAVVDSYVGTPAVPTLSALRAGGSASAAAAEVVLSLQLRRADDAVDRLAATRQDVERWRAEGEAARAQAEARRGEE